MSEQTHYNVFTYIGFTKKLEHHIVVSRGVFNKWPNDWVAAEEPYTSTMLEK